MMIEFDFFCNYTGVALVVIVYFDFDFYSV